MTTQYPALGFDPAPGTVSSVDAAVAALRRSARGVGRAADQLWGADEAEWLGATATEFKNLLEDDLRPPVRDATDMLARAATTLEGWADALEEFQRRARALESEAAQAQSSAAAAHRTIDALPAAPPPGTPPPTDPAATRRAERREQDRESARTTLAEAEDQLADCRRRAHRLHDEYELEADRVGATLAKASSATPPSTLGEAGRTDPDPLSFPYDLAFLTPEELDEYARTHPEHAADILEYRLRQEGLLTGGEPGGYYRRWLENAVAGGTDPDTILEIARRHGIRPDDFEVLDGLEEITDPDGKSYFLLPSEITGDDARRAVLMTYLLNADLRGYGTDGQPHDFEPTPYSADEFQRIVDRQQRNGWSYDADVEFVNGNHGRLMTTPNGILTGLGGNWWQDRFSFSGGTTWGDTFMLNIDSPADADAAQVLREMVTSGRTYYQFDDGSIGLGASQLDLDRLLHHEERHSQQWAELGYSGFLDGYLTHGAIEWVRNHTPLPDGHNPFEEDAGLGDGGYR